MKTGARVIVGGVFATMVGFAGVGSYNLYQGLTGSSGVSPAPEVKSGPVSEAEARKTARAFLTAWAKGKPEQAAALTDNAASAGPALDSFQEDLHISELKLTAAEQDGVKIPFSVRAELVVDGKTSTWTYDSSLRVKRGERSGKALVDWQASVIHPKLKRGESLAAGAAKAPPVEVVDRNGTVLDTETYPSLSAVLPQLRQEYGDDAGGSPGSEVWISDAHGETGETLHTIKKGKPGKLRTTLDAATQRAAEQAVRKFDTSSVAAVQPSTGRILAFANNPADGFNTAFLGKQPPGSTMKVVSAAMLLEKGLVSAYKKAECPKYANGGGRQFHNLNKFEITPDDTFAESFARSCNTAFIKFAGDLGNGDLTRTAREVFGLGRDDWKIGVPTADGTIPEAGGPNKAAALIGQGQLQMNPLNMASVAATAKAGIFKQPILVPVELDNRPLAKASRALSPSVAEQLRTMMRRTATSGTGAKVMAPLGGDIGAKTGSAEADGEDATSWFLGYRGDIAAAAVVQQGGHGGDAAGPVVADVLRAGR
ncbi:penicillin-binding protein [Streptomyces gobiensis]|nr:penicillin-binding transpeptidase domain-containing protein [Streptomyces gobiensis]UGY95070.1 penicillin-binding protein [Streptomyces gobiensis]